MDTDFKDAKTKTIKLTGDEKRITINNTECSEKFKFSFHNGDFKNASYGEGKMYVSNVYFFESFKYLSIFYYGKINILKK